MLNKVRLHCTDPSGLFPSSWTWHNAILSQWEQLIMGSQMIETFLSLSNSLQIQIYMTNEIFSIISFHLLSICHFQTRVLLLLFYRKGRDLLYLLIFLAYTLHVQSRGCGRGAFELPFVFKCRSTHVYPTELSFEVSYSADAALILHSSFPTAKGFDKGPKEAEMSEWVPAAPQELLLCFRKLLVSMVTEELENNDQILP